MNHVTVIFDAVVSQSCKDRKKKEAVAKIKPTEHPELREPEAGR